MVESINPAATAESIAKILALIAAGAWAFWRFAYQGEFKRRVSFTVDVNFVTALNEVWLVELIASVDNKGLVTHRITQFVFELRSIDSDDPVTDAGEKANWQTNLPHRLIKGSWLPLKWVSTFVRPGICNRYSYVTTVPKTAVAVTLTGRFNYTTKGDAFHTASKTVKVPEFKSNC